MRRIRFTIASLLVVVLFVAIGFAALRESNDLWESGVFTLTLVRPADLDPPRRPSHRIQAGILARVRPVRLELPGALPGPVDRIQADDDQGACLPGLQSAGAILRNLHRSARRDRTLERPAIRSRIVAFTADGNQTCHLQPRQVRLWDAATGRLLGGWSGTTENFVRIGHSLFALLAGWFGGLLSRRLCRASRSPETAAAGLS